MPQLGGGANIAAAAPQFMPASASALPAQTGTSLMAPGMEAAQAANAAEAFQPGLSGATPAEAPWYQGLSDSFSSMTGGGASNEDSVIGEQMIRQQLSNIGEAFGDASTIQGFDRPYSGAPIPQDIGPGQQNLAQLLQMMAAQRGR